MDVESAPPKPRTGALRVELTQLPELTPARLRARRFLRAFCRFLAALLTRPTLRGIENIPLQGPALVVSNHLGDADAVIGIAYSPRLADFIAKVELYDIPVVGKLLHAYGMIWVHRGQPDRRALRAALDGLALGRLVTIAPEGRESLTGALEEGTNGAAFLALKSGMPILPITLTGTENKNLFAHWKRLRRAPVSLTVGPLFTLPNLPDRREALRQGTETIMRTLAHQLPPEYRGVYEQTLPASETEELHGR